MRRLAWILLAALIVAGLVLAGCQAAAPEPESGGSAAGREPAAVSEPQGAVPSGGEGQAGKSPEEPVSSGPPSEGEEADEPTPQPVAQSDNFRLFTPAPDTTVTVGQPLTIRGQARVFEATFSIELEDGHNLLAEEVVTADEGAPGWGDFEVQLDFDPPTSPHGTLLFVTYSAQDGSRQEELVVPVKFDRVVPLGS